MPPSPAANFLRLLRIRHMFLRETEERVSVVRSPQLHTYTSHIILRFLWVHASRFCCRTWRKPPLLLLLQLNFLAFSHNLFPFPNRRQKFFHPRLQMRHMNDCPFMRSETCKGERARSASGVKKRLSFWECVKRFTYSQLGFDKEHEPESIYQTLKILFHEKDILALAFGFSAIVLGQISDVFCSGRLTLYTLMELQEI